MERKIPQTCLKEKYGCYLEEFNNTSFLVFGAERVES